MSTSKLVLRFLIVLFTLTGLGSTAHAANSDVPDSLDVSGRWVLEPTVLPPYGYIRPGSGCEGLEWAAPGRATLDLHYVDVEIANTGVRYDFNYEGTLTYYNSFRNSYPTDWLCHIQSVEFRVTGRVRYQETGEGPESNFLFNAHYPECDPREALAGECGGEVAQPYHHPIHMSLQGSFADTSGDRLLVRQLSGSTNSENGDLYPSQCEAGSVTYRYYALLGTWDGERCVDLVTGEDIFARGHFIRSGTPSSLETSGAIRGRLLDQLPDGTPTTDPIQRAEVSLFRQQAPVRDRVQGETQADYDTYLLTQRATWELAGTSSIYPDGTFLFDDVLDIRRLETGRGNAYGRTLYTLEVHGAERDVDVAGEITTFVYATAPMHNIRVGYDDTTYLTPVTALEVKRELSTRLSDFAPYQYLMVEQGVRGYLDQLEAGTITITDARVEGVERAAWSERSILLAAELAKQLLETSMKSLAELLGDLVDSKLDTTPKALKDAKERTANLKQAQDFAAGTKSAWGFGGRDYAALQGAIDKLGKQEPQVKAGAFFERFTKFFKYAIALPIKTGLVRAGMEPGKAAGIVSTLDDWVIKMAEAVFTGNRKGRVEVFVKTLTETLIRDALFDNAIDSFPSFAALTRPFLERSDTRMRGWTGDDRPTYAGQRAATVEVIGRFLNQGSRILEQNAMLQGLAEGTGNASDVYELGSAIPAFRLAAKITKLVKRLSHVGAFVRPMLFLYGDLVDGAEEASYMAFGDVPPQPYTVLPGQPSATVYTNGPSIAQADVRSRWNSAYFAIRTALAGDDIYEAMLLTTDEGPEGFEGATRSMMESQRLAAASAASAIGTTGKVDLMNAKQAERLLVFDAAYMVAWRQLMDLYLNVLSEQYVSPADGRYRAARKASLTALNQLNIASTAFRLGQNALDVELADELVLPAVVVDRAVAISDASGGDTVLTSGETFTVSARLSNVSSAPVANLSARLRVIGTEELNTTVADSEKPVGTGTLAAYDSAGSADEAVVTWSVTYTGDIDDLHGVVMGVQLLENGAAPQSFVAVDAALGLMPDPTVYDADEDGLPDPWERDMGLDPTTNDYAADNDADGVANWEELSLGLNPLAADTDSDGLNDGEEVTGGADGWVTNPLVADSDLDGTDDAADGAPLDATSTAATGGPPEPIVAVGQTDVVLMEGEVVTVAVSNAGGGELVWTAAAEPEGLVRINPTPDQARGESHSLNLELLAPLNQLPNATVVVRVVDLSGQDPDEVSVNVRVQGSLEGPAGGDMGPSAADMGPNTADMGQGNANNTTSDMGFGTNGNNPGRVDSERGAEGGCCRTTGGHPSDRAPAVWLIIAAVVWVRRR